MKLRSLALVAMATALLAAAGCLAKRSFNSNESSTDLTKLRSEGVATIDWPCSGTGLQHPAGKNSQEEYCEWTRSPVGFNSVGRKINGGADEAVVLAKACVFTTSFDQTRAYHLTRNIVGGDKGDEGNPFHPTQFNSYAFLVGGTEPDTGAAPTGIIPHCIRGNACGDGSGNCKPNRASDPQICRALNQLSDKGCQIDTSFEFVPVINAGAIPRARHGDRAVKLQLSVRASIAPKCWYAKDPKMPLGTKNGKGEAFRAAEQQTLVVCDAAALGVSDCDAIAPDITTVAALKIKDMACVGGTNGGGTGGGSSVPFGTKNATCKIKSSDGLPANVRASDSSSAEVLTQLNTGTEVFVTDFKGDWVSVKLASFGRANGPYIHKSQFDSTCRK